MDFRRLMADDWQEEGLCRGLDPEMFYPSRGVRTNTVRAICDECPVRHPCAEWGIAHEGYGLWGGLSERQRMIIRRERGISIQAPGAWALTEYFAGVQ